MLVDMHAHVIPGALDPVGQRDDHKGPRVGPCDDPHARLLENDRMQFKARDAFYSAQRRLEELERSEVDAEVVSPMPPLLDYGLTGKEGLDLSRRVNEFIAELTRTDPNRLLGMAICLGLFALGCVLAYGLRTGCRYLVAHSSYGIPIWQWRKQ